MESAVVGGLAPAARWPRLVEVITDEENLVHANFSEAEREAPPDAGWEVEVGGYLREGHPPPWWDVERQVVRAQPFFRYVVHDALVTAGRADLVSRQLLDWGWALDRCPTSLTETWYGGTISHGLMGLFLGPIVLAVFYELVLAWMQVEPGERPRPAAQDGSSGSPCGDCNEVAAAQFDSRSRNAYTHQVTCRWPAVCEAASAWSAPGLPG